MPCSAADLQHRLQPGAAPFVQGHEVLGCQRLGRGRLARRGQVDGQRLVDAVQGRLDLHQVGVALGVLPLQVQERAEHQPAIGRDPGLGRRGIQHDLVHAGGDNVLLVVAIVVRLAAVDRLGVDVLGLQSGQNLVIDRLRKRRIVGGLGGFGAQGLPAMARGVDELLPLRLDDDQVEGLVVEIALEGDPAGLRRGHDLVGDVQRDTARLGRLDVQRDG